MSLLGRPDVCGLLGNRACTMVSDQVVLRSNKRLKFAPFYSAGRLLRSRCLAGR